MKITKKQFDTAQKKLSKKSLSGAQKQNMLAHIYANTQSPVDQPVVSPLSSYFLFFRQRAFVAVATLVLIFSGTSYASAQSLPGDLLYGLKVDVLEPIGLALQLSEEAKSNYKVSLLKKRIAELEELKERGAANEESQKASSKAANKNIKELEQSAIFSSEGTNEDVSEKIKMYNVLVDPALEIETTIEVDDLLETDSAETPVVELKNDGLDAVEEITSLPAEPDSKLDTSSDVMIDVNTSSVDTPTL